MDRSIYSKIKSLIFVVLLLFPYILDSQIYVKASATGANNGTSWANAYTSLKTAINNASSGDQIWVAEGTYYPTTGTSRSVYFKLKNGVEIYGGFPNTGNPGWSDRNYTTHPTILSGDIGTSGDNTDNTYHVVYNSGTINNTAILDGFIIEKGYASGRSGGGMYFRNASPTIRNCIIRDNYAENDGAGIYMRDNCSNATFTNCEIRNNDADDDCGGIYLTNSNCNPTFANCIIDSNHGDDNGGGVRIYNCSPVFNNSTISNNVVDEANKNGGGFYISGSSNPSITNCTISGNTATNFGGGIYTISTALTNAISGNTIDGNQVTGGNARGAGIYLDNSSPVISGNIIKNNVASTSTDDNGRGQGAGLFIYGSDITSLISNNTFSNNTATSTGNGSSCGRGGGIFIYQSPVTLQNNIIENNTATSSGNGNSCGYGGGLYVYRASVSMQSNTIRNNTAKTDGTGNYCGRGGGIYLTQSTGVNLTGNTISSNVAIDYGAGIYMYQSDPVLSNNTISGNIINSAYDNTGRGAGLFIYDDTGSGTSPTLTSNTISNNQANDNGHANAGYGGGVVIRTGVKPVFTSNTFLNNSASQRGGAVYIRDNSTEGVFNRNNFNGNSANDGGAVYYDGNNTSKFYNNLIHNNSATNGGAVYFRNNDNGTFLNNTVADNSATNGGAFYFNNDADLTIKNTILWNNTASSSGDNVYIADNGSDPYFQYCDVEGGRSNFAGGGAGGYNSGHYSNNIDADPQFSDAVYHLTLGSSPCIGAGDPSTASGDFPSNEDYDANIRVRGVIDIGAYETNNPPQFTTSGGADNPGPENVTMDEDGNPTPFSLTLYAQDLDDDALTWSILTPASHGTATVPASTSPPNLQSVAVNYTPDANYNGSDMFRVQISDGTLTDVIEVDVTINSVNDTPYFTTTPPVLYIKAQQTWTYNIATNDVDDPLSSLTLSCINKPSGMTFSAGSNGTGTLTWTPTDAQVSPPTYHVTLRVKDPHGDYVDQDFDLTVVTRFIFVPADYPTIQQAINAAVDGQDKIIVANGTYTENVNTLGKTIEIEGNTSNPSKVIIDGGSSGACITVDQGGSPTISGFKLTNGTGNTGLPSGNTVHAPASGMYGGAVVVYNSSPTFRDMVIDGNSLQVNNNNGGSGGGMYVGSNSNVTLEGIDTTFVIKNNHSSVYRGGGICLDDSQITLKNARIENNYAGNYGGGIAAFNSTVDLTNVRITGNSVDGKNGYGGGIYSHNSTVNKHSGVNINGNSASRSGNNQFVYP